MKHIILLLAMIVLLSSSIYGQAIPKQISYQGVLKDAAGNLLNGDQAMTFKIYNDPTGGTALWTEIQAVAVANGLFSVQLGSTNSITTVPFDRLHFLGIAVGTGSELLPRTLLSPTPYSFMSMNVVDNAITSSKIQNLIIVNDDIANSTISVSKLNFTPGTGTITGVQVGSGLLGGGTAGIVTISVKDTGITTDMLKPNSITSDKIDDGTIIETDIGSNQIIKSLNGLRDNINLEEGNNINIVKTENNLRISTIGKYNSTYTVINSLTSQVKDLNNYWKQIIEFQSAFVKDNDSSKIEVYLNSLATGGTFNQISSKALFEIRINDTSTPIANYGVVSHSDAEEYLSITAVFVGLQSGSYNVSVWAKMHQTTSSGARLDPDELGGTIIVKGTY